MEWWREAIKRRLHEWHRRVGRHPTLLENWIDEVYRIVRAARAAEVDLGPANMRLWRWYKAEGAPRAPEYVRPLEAFALYLLREGVNA
jgi:hypothetical protein